MNYVNFKMFRILILLTMCLGVIHTNATQKDFEIDNRIIGGQRCSVADHKYMIAVLFTDSNTYLCGGSLLASRWALTARHCMSDTMPPKLYTIVAGVESNLEHNWGKYKQMSVVEYFYNHPDDDISLLHLKESINESPLVGYVTPATYLTMQGRKLEDFCSNSTVMGWGFQMPMEDDRLVISADEYLQCLNLPVISPQECYEMFNEKNKPNVSDSNFCAYKPDADTCMGDSGSPFICEGIQYGIVSYDYGCAVRGNPGVYVKVFNFENFIRDTMKEVNENGFQNRNCSGVKHSFLAAIIHNDIKTKYQEYLCAGSMLTEKWVLTSGLCTMKCKTPSYYTVIAGVKESFKFDPNDNSFISSKVEQCYQCPKHNKFTDIALMKLKNGFRSSKAVSFIQIATPWNIKSNDFKKVCGSGTLIGYRQLKNAVIQNPQCIQTTVSSDQQCRKIWSPNKIESQHACLDEPKRRNCYTTPGAPLVCRGIQYGVLTSVACSASGNPNSEEKPSYLIAKVYEYDDFLQEMVYNKTGTDAYLKNYKDNMKIPVNLYILIFYFVLFLI